MSRLDHDALIAFLTARALVVLAHEYEDDISPEDTFGYNSDEENAEACAFVRRLADTTSWGWCRVTVIASCYGFRGQASLGGCSYGSEDEFRAGGYYDDMVAEAISNMADAILTSEAVIAMIVRDVAGAP